MAWISAKINLEALGELTAWTQKHLLDGDKMQKLGQVLQGIIEKKSEAQAEAVVWLKMSSISDEAIDELATVCDHLFDLGGIAGVIAEKFDRAVFKAALMKAKETLLDQLQEDIK